MSATEVFNLDGRVALITGGSRGLGLEMAYSDENSPNADHDPIESSAALAGTMRVGGSVHSTTPQIPAPAWM